VPWEWAPAQEGGAELLGHLHYLSERAVILDTGEAAVLPGAFAPEYQLHRRVWFSALAAWEQGQYTEAVKAASFFAAGSLLQEKLNAFDLAGVELITEALSTDPPGPGRPRLRLPQVRPDTEAWASGLSGVKHLGIGCLMTAKGLGSTPLEADDALDFLAGLSVFARWIDRTTVVYWEDSSAGAHLV
jgi:hypothetical protein